MVNSKECIEVLKALVKKFETRLEEIRKMQDEVEENLRSKTKSDAKMLAKYQKELEKMQNQTQKLDEKQLAKQEKLLNCNNLQELENDIMKNSIKLLAEDTGFLDSLKEMLEEAKESQFSDELVFSKDYLILCEKTSKVQHDIYLKQQKFLEEIFEEEE